jgi:hypothetical protein
LVKQNRLRKNLHPDLQLTGHPVIQDDVVVIVHPGAVTEVILKRK